MMSLETPKYDLKNFPNVYEPAEDSFLFLDALEKEIPFLQKLEPDFAVEIGSGSGIVITSLNQVLKECVFFATDINPEACLATASTAELNSTYLNCINMNLLSSFKRYLFDLILFNPPYVVTDSEEIEGNGLNRAWAGGDLGREITDKVLEQLPDWLSDNGVCYMVLLKENDVDGVKKVMLSRKFGMEVVMDRKIPGEHLYVVKFYRLK